MLGGSIDTLLCFGEPSSISPRTEKEFPMGTQIEKVEIFSP